jgi:hypothetical protein
MYMSESPSKPARVASERWSVANGAQTETASNSRALFGEISSKIPTAPCNDMKINKHVSSRQCIENWVERVE